MISSEFERRSNGAAVRSLLGGVRRGCPRWVIAIGQLAGVALLCALAPARADAAQNIATSTIGRDYTVYRISQPIVTQPKTSYPTMTFRAGDVVRVSAGGCVQTGGHGPTWKRYVDPTGSNATNLYHGLVQIPGHGMVPIVNVIGQTMSVPANASTNALSLGYQDDGYSDNGYYSPDNGTENQCKGVGPAWVVVVVQHVVVSGGTFTPIPAMTGINGLPILRTDYRNVAFDTTDPLWTGPVCHNARWLANDPPRYEWTPVYQPTQEYDNDPLGISGMAVSPADVSANGGVSGDDVPFTHPFGGVDWETFIAPDDAYSIFLGGSNTGIPPKNDTSKNNQEYIDANARAVALHLNVPKGVQGNETDKDFIPFPYRAREGDRVAVLGRWIVDCGHEDFHTEIHPPLLFVRAQAIASGSNPDAPSNATPSVTYARIIGRPFLPGQEFGDGALRAHLKEEIEKVLEFRSNRVEAHPKLYAKPFAGTHIFSYIVRAPVLPPAQRLAISRAQLMCNFHFTTRTGVAVQVVRETADSVRVYVTLNAAAYVAAPFPVRSDFNVTFASLKKSEPSEATDINLLLAGAIVDRGVFAADINKGVITDRYAAPIAASVTDGQIIEAAVDALPGGPHFSIDNGQPFPIYGWLSLEWRAAPIVVKPSKTRLNTVHPGPVKVNG